MNQLSEKLSLLSKNQQQIVEYSIININYLIGDILKEIHTYAMNKNIELTFDASMEELLVKGDNFAIKQAFTNLIDNAIKYNQPGGRVHISTYKDGQKAIVVVEDDGIGISEENQKHIFDRFFRVDKSRSRAQGGTGLGLAIVKEIIESHKGTVSVKSEPDAGSVFTITLPLYNADCN
jgi:two-component system phosphate regulon sensor histidine kinase PhoR